MQFIIPDGKSDFDIILFSLLESIQPKSGSVNRAFPTHFCQFWNVKLLSRNVVFWISKFMQNSYVNFNGNGQMRCRRRDSSLMRRQLDWWVADATRHRRHRPLDISKLTTGVAFGDGHVTVLVTGLWEVSNDSCRYVTDLITQMLTVIRLLKVSLSSPCQL